MKGDKGLSIERVEKSSLMLRWRSNLPRFVIDEHVGDTLTLYFGITNIDDIELAVFYFIAKLLKHEDRWLLDARLHQLETNSLVPKPQVSTLTCKLNLGLETGKDLDFREYFENWSKEYRDFSVVVTDSALPHLVPKRISRDKILKMTSKKVRRLE